MSAKNFWRFLKTKPSQEDLAELSLERLGVESFCPQIGQNKIIRRKWQAVSYYLFRGWKRFYTKNE